MRIIIISLLLANFSFGQTINTIEENFSTEIDYKADNVVSEFKSFDFNFSSVWTNTENHKIFGIIGDEHQRIRIKLISVFRISSNPLLYNVYGKSKVKNTICEFYGSIRINQIKEVKELHFGVDDMYADKGIKKQGILIAEYEFYENKEQKHSGIFKGKLHTKWYLNANNEIEYDNILSFADGYINNAFVGIWKSYSSGKEKLCNWADYRVPNANRDFDIGAGEFGVSKKYLDKGWENYQKAWLYGDKTAKTEELKEWWK